MPKMTVLALMRAMHAGGGVPLNLASLLKHIAACTQWRVLLITASKAGAPPLLLDSIEGLEVCVLNTRRLPSALERILDCCQIGFKAELLNALPAADIVHCHSLWRYPTRIGCPIMRHLGKPYMIAPRGTLNPWALGYRGLRKKFALWTHERKNLSKAACLHATSEAEVTHLRNLGLSQPIALIPSGVREEALIAFDAAFKNNQNGSLAPREKRRVLCVSRLHPIKRIKELAQVWASLADSHLNWELEIVGTGLLSYENDIRATLKEYPAARSRTTFKGYLSGADLWEAYLRADLLVLPSHSENFGSVVVEALAAQVPVIATKGTPWEKLQKEKCGWWIGMEQWELRRAMIEAMSLTDNQRREMGLRGRLWVLQEFSWPEIARNTVEVYDWILQGCNRAGAPNCVYFKN